MDQNDMHQTFWDTYKIEVGTFALVTVVSLLLFVMAAIDKETGSQTAAALQTNVVSIVESNPFDSLILEASAVYVWNTKKQEVLYAKNEEAQLPLASLTKLMTALVAYDTLPLSSTIVISNDALSAEGDSGLFMNEKWNLQDLLNFTLLVSSNDGASAIADTIGSLYSDFPDQYTENKRVFVGQMNAKARNIGLTQTYFINETGLDTTNYAGGGYGSARDIAHLLEDILLRASQIVAITKYPSHKFISESNITHSATNTNKALGNIPGLIASKTGFTDLAGGNLVIAYDAGINYPIIISVLGSTQDGRFRDVEKLVEASLKSLAL